jgi:hypothetical protein
MLAGEILGVKVIGNCGSHSKGSLSTFGLLVVVTFVACSDEKAIDE